MSTSVDKPTEMEISEDRGKGKAVEDVPENDTMEENDEEDSDSDEEDEEHIPEEAAVEEEGIEEIDPKNIVEGGRRTRGANIDFAKAAAENPDEDDDDDDDDDFQPPTEDTDMSG